MQMLKRPAHVAAQHETSSGASDRWVAGLTSPHIVSGVIDARA